MHICRSTQAHHSDSAQTSICSSSMMLRSNNKYQFTSFWLNRLGIESTPRGANHFHETIKERSPRGDQNTLTMWLSKHTNHESIKTRLPCGGHSTLTMMRSKHAYHEAIKTRLQCGGQSTLTMRRSKHAYHVAGKNINREAVEERQRWERQRTLTMRRSVWIG